VEFAARPRTNAEIEDLLQARLGDHKPGVWWALRTFAPLVRAPIGGPWSFGSRSSYLAAGIQLPPERRDECVQRLVRRYLEAFGPASAADVAQFTWLTRSVVRDALRALVGELAKLGGPDGAALFDVPGAPLPAEDTPAPPRLMPMWDSILLAYHDRSRVFPPDYRRLVIRQNGDVLPTLLVDGYVAGVSRPVGGGIEATAFHRLSDEAWTGLAAEARALMAVLVEREPLKLPSTEARLLPS